jgi:hypothetical protein
MSRVEIIDQRYRLQPEDLAGAPRRLVVANVTLQGLEEMVPTLHFEGQEKRLPLSAEQSRALTELTGTPVLRDWIGATVILAPTRSTDGAGIRILSPTVARRAGAIPAPVDQERRNWRMALITVGVLITASSVYLLVNLDAVLAALQQLLLLLD